MSAIKNISLFIPHVYNNYTMEMVSNIFENMEIGRVKNVDFVHKMGKDDKEYNAAYIHFYEWYDNTIARNFQERVLNPEKEARVMYDDPWYWIVLENNGKKRVPGERKPRIDLDAFNTPEKPIAPTLEPGAPLKMKSWAQIVHNATPVNLQNAFNAEAEADHNKITEREMEWAIEQMENDQILDTIEAEMMMDDYYLSTFDKRYIQSLEQENDMLRYQLAYYQNHFNKWK